MTWGRYKGTALSIFAACALFSTECSSLEEARGAHAIMIAAKKPKCSAPGVADYEGTDMSGVTPRCQAIFDTCVDDSAPCNIRKQKCAEFDKMDGNGSCYKKGR